MRETSRWAALCTGRGGGDRVKNEGALMTNGYIWGGGSKVGETNNLENGRREKVGQKGYLKSVTKSDRAQVRKGHCTGLKYHNIMSHSHLTHYWLVNNN